MNQKMMENQTVHEREGQEIRRSQWVALTGIMSGLALLGNYALVGVPNVEMGSSILFVTAYVFGFHMAIWCTLIMSIIFGMFNPWGALLPQIYLCQLAGWFVVVAAGAIEGRNRGTAPTSQTSPIEFGVLGAVTTLFFDLITNLGFSWAFDLPYFGVVAYGLPYMMVHVTSNFFIFLVVVPVISRLIDRSFGAAIWRNVIEHPVSLGEE
ncbi:MAG: hypothetical protein C4K47_10495 [Candidatus Thorarchaeota archaeon]|nr:MAG: hypothetical protein C4K47_10495 [Candidatus Thorarchaeota archaeon]